MNNIHYKIKTESLWDASDKIDYDPVVDSMRMQIALAIGDPIRNQVWDQIRSQVLDQAKGLNEV